jgi:type IV pilus assembly protein PilQ
MSQSARTVVARQHRFRSVPLWLSLLAGGLVGVDQALAQGAPSAPAPRDPTRPGSSPEADKGKVKVSEHDTVDIHVKDESINNVLELLGIGSQRNIVVSKNVSGKVSADLYNVTFTEALNAILRVNGLDYVQEGNFIFVYTAEEMAEMKKRLIKRQAKVITLSYLNANDAAEFVKPLLSQGAEIKFAGKTEEFQIPSNAPAGRDSYALGATLVVIDYPENIAAIEQVLTELDTKPAQVLVQATVLQTSVNEDNAFGVDISIIADVRFTDFLTVGGPKAVADALNIGGDGTKGSGVSPAGNQAVAIGSTPGKTAGKSTMKIGVIGSNVAAFVRLLDEVSDTVVLSNPKLLTLNRQPARVLVGERVAYLSTTQTDTSQTQRVEFLDTGVQLYVRPFVGPNNEIRMELKPQISSATPVNIKAGSGEVTVPNEVTQEVVTNVIVKDGMTVVLGGLFQESTTASRTQVPVLGDIPVVGAAFRGHEDSVKRSEIIFLVTPTVMSDASLLVEGKESNRLVQRVTAGARQGLLPWSRERMTSILNVEADHLAREGETDKALWKLQKSLSYNPRQPDALRLRERLTGEREIWPSRNTLAEIISEEIRAKHNAITPPAQPPVHHNPWGSHPIQREPLGKDESAPAPAPAHGENTTQQPAQPLTNNQPTEATPAPVNNNNNAGNNTASAAPSTVQAPVSSAWSQPSNAEAQANQNAQANPASAMATPPTASMNPLSEPAQPQPEEPSPALRMVMQNPAATPKATYLSSLGFLRSFFFVSPNQAQAPTTIVNVPTDDDTK